jgi:hypothetical protein
MFDSASSTSTESLAWFELDPQEAQDSLDTYFKATAVLTARIWSKHPRSRRRPNPTPEVKISAPTNWWDMGQALRARFLERAGDRCDCYSCRYQSTKRGQRENYWITAVALAQMGDPSLLVEHLNSRRHLTQFDRRILADLLEGFFKGETRISASAGRPKNISVQACASVAIKFYTDWKAINRQWRIKDWGHSDEMKDEACRVAIDCHRARTRREGRVPISNHPMDRVPDLEQVRELMDRPRSRRR